MAFTGTAISWIVTAVSTAATAYTAYAGYQQAKTESSMAEYNAEIEKQSATRIAEESRLKADQVRKERAVMLGKQRAIIGGSGATAEGSPLLTFSDTAVKFEEEAASTYWQGLQKAQEHLQRAEHYKWQSKELKRAGKYKMYSSLLSSLSSSFK